MMDLHSRSIAGRQNLDSTRSPLKADDRKEIDPPGALVMGRAGP
jgi:hypothetical protein